MALNDGAGYRFGADYSKGLFGAGEGGELKDECDCSEG